MNKKLIKTRIGVKVNKMKACRLICNKYPRRSITININKENLADCFEGHGVIIIIMNTFMNGIPNESDEVENFTTLE